MYTFQWFLGYSHILQQSPQFYFFIIFKFSHPHEASDITTISEYLNPPPKKTLCPLAIVFIYPIYLNSEQALISCLSLWNLHIMCIQYKLNHMTWSLVYGFFTYHNVFNI